NIERMAKKAGKFNMEFRPHFKTHQSAKIGEWFRQSGVTAITVSSVSMAEYFASNGWDDITIAIPVNIHEISHIDRLASSIKINVLIENKEAANELKNRINNNLGVYIKIDTGYHRTGILSAKTSTIDSILEILRGNNNLGFKGFLSHTGHSYTANSVHEIHSRHFDALLKMRKLKQHYLKKYPNIKISMGDTPSCSICETFDGVDEIRPGNFVFYDYMQYKLGACRLEDIAVKMVCPVISKHRSRNEIVIYGGAIHLSKESITHVDGKAIYGRVIVNVDEKKVLLDELNYVSKLSQEHGIIRVTQKNFPLFNIGDFVEIIPVHSCLTANLMGKYLTTEGEEISIIPR
ncbi:MAG: alanine racemase, partial [Prolixibacteraceae bacterium]|nr:alanine racemase [Prolixibacteraceae bacterium]